jgi:hypothetical protein
MLSLRFACEPLYAADVIGHSIIQMTFDTYTHLSSGDDNDRMVVQTCAN